MVAEVGLQDSISKFNSGEPVEAFAFDGPGITAFAREDDRCVHAEASNVNAEGKGIGLVSVDFPGHGFVDVRCREEFHQALTRELT